jgi:membrane protein required for colicin V production
MGWVDIVLLSLLGISVLLGLWRGLVYELMALAGWVVAYIGSAPLAPLVAGWLPQDRFDASLLHGLSLVLAFVLILVVWGLAARLVQMLVRATPLSLLDRLLGGGFGVLRGLLIALLVVLVASMSPLSRSESWQASVIAPWLRLALHGLSPVLPDDVVKFIATV